MGLTAYSVVYGRADLIEYQLRCLRRFCPSVTELVIGNNGPNHPAIDAECQRLGLRFMRGYSNDRDPSRSHAAMLNQLWVQMVDHSEDTLLLDMDVFPGRFTEPARLFHVEEDICASMAGVIQLRGEVRYPWPGFLAIKGGIPGRDHMRFDPTSFMGEWCDTGGSVARYIAVHSELRFACLHEFPATPETHCWSVLDGDWLHFRAASNWWKHDSDEEEQRSNNLKAFLETILV